MKQIIVIFFLSFLFSCSATRNEKHWERIHGLTNRQKYLDAEIKEQRGDTVTLKGIAGVYILQNGTLTRIKKQKP